MASGTSPPPVAESPRVAIVGAGVIGLTTAVTLAREGCAVTVFAGRRGLDVTSSVAGASWYPYAVGGYQRTWAATTYFNLLAESLSPETTGVRRQAAREYVDAGAAPVPLAPAVRESAVGRHVDSLWWRRLPGVDMRRAELSDEELTFDFGDDPLGRRTFAGAVDFSTVSVKTDRYLAYLERTLLEAGGRIVERWIDDLRRLGREHRFAAVINCAGFAAEMFADSRKASDLHAAAGQVVRVAAPQVKRLTVIHTGPFEHSPLYVVPRGGGESEDAGEVILGGSYEAVDVSVAQSPMPAVDELLAQRIARRCQTIEPALVGMQVQQCRTGLRPVARQIQVGRDASPPASGDPLVFNNYGHGGAGVSLCWGTAAAVACDVMRNLHTQ